MGEKTTDNKCAGYDCDNEVKVNMGGIMLCEDCLAQRWEEAWRAELELA